jgi:hypothetical protein
VIKDKRSIDHGLKRNLNNKRTATHPVMLAATFANMQLLVGFSRRGGKPVSTFSATE